MELLGPVGINLELPAQSHAEDRISAIKNRPDSKLSGGLQVISDAARNMDHPGRGPDADRELNEANPLARIGGGRVTIDAVAEDGMAPLLLNELRALGLEGGARFGNVVSGELPASALGRASRLDSLNFMDAVAVSSHVGSVDSQGAQAMNADLAAQNFGVDGSGQKIGILSDSFNTNASASTDYNDDIISGDLPSGIELLDDTVNGSDEGRAMAQLIHDTAPGADLAFHTAFTGSAAFAQGIVDLANAGSTVIVDDVFYSTQPFFQDGIIAQAVDQVFNDGVAYFSSAGNAARNAHEEAYSSSGTSFGGLGNLHQFTAGGDTIQEFQVGAGQTATFSFQWDEPFASAGGAGSASDLDFLIVDAGLNVLNNIGPTATGTVVGGLNSNVNRDASEFVSVQNATAFPQIYGIITGIFSGPVPNLIKHSITNVQLMNHFDSSGTSFGHPNAEGGLGVGAAYYNSTPPFGTSPPVIESFSSAGGPAGGPNTPILFDISGNRLGAPEIRERVDIVGPDGTDTTFFGADRDGNTFPISAEHRHRPPHVAALAALMLEVDPTLTPTQIYDHLRNNAIDMDDPGTAGFDTGYDNLTGHGLVDALATMNQLTPADDFSGDILTTGSVAVGGTQSGSIEVTGDIDFLQVSLQAGKTYQISIDEDPGAPSPLADPLATLYDQTGAGILVTDDNSGPGLGAEITHTAIRTGDYFIAASESGGDDTGGYEVSVTDLMTPADFVLIMDVTETGDFGNKFNGQTDADGVITGQFENTGLDLDLSVTGFDVDFANEVEVLVNGDSLGFLSNGADNGLNGGDTFSMAAIDLPAGTNTLQFVQNLNVNFTWGITDILLADASAAPDVDFTLSRGVTETGSYGNKFNNQFDPDGVITASFAGTGSNLDLSLLGFDIDFANEVKVSLNGNSLGFLTTGPNNGFNGGDIFTISAADQLLGTNTLTFEQNLNNTYKWGITNILLEDAFTPPAIDFALTLEVLETGSYGNKFNGETDADGVIAASFESNGTDLDLSLTGFDVDFANEIEVLLNGDSLGFLTTGPNNGFNGGDIFTISAAGQLPGTNTLTFEQKLNNTYKWGITNILLEESDLPPVVDFVLTTGIPETGNYGNKFNGETEADGVVLASFENTGMDLELTLTGFDVDFANEIEVLLNDNSLGFLSAGPDNGLNGGDNFTINVIDLAAGTNILAFEQNLNNNFKWGVTDILIDNAVA